MQFNKKIVKKNFDNNAFRYQENAIIQRLVAKKLIEDLVKLFNPINFNNQRIVDLGSGSGFVFQELITKISNHNFFYQADLSEKMLEISSFNQLDYIGINCDIEYLPFKKNSFDLALSSFTMQWLNDQKKFIENIYNILSTNGIFAFAIPVNQSLKDLKSMNLFNLTQLPSSKQIQENINFQDFKILSCEELTIKQNFNNPIDAVNSLKKIGANYHDINTKFNNKFNQEILSLCRSYNKNNLHNSNYEFTMEWIIKFYFLLKKC